MKNIRNATLGIFFALLCVSTSAAAPARGDDADDVRDSRVVSARAGRVNFVSGEVRLRRAGSLEWQRLTADDELKGGDTVTTGAAGRVEILLNPGSYFRAGAGAEFTLAEADLDNLRVELARGSAVVEAMGYRDTELSITVATARSTVRIIRSGIYRVNALADGAAEVAVFEGRALLDGTLSKGGKVARAGAAGVEVSKLDKNDRDELDLWSRDRGKELAKANERIQRRTLNSLFARNSYDRLFGPYYASGFWFYNDRTSCYTFVPFGADWRSPYGYGYGTGVVLYPSSPYPGQRWPGQTPPPGYTPPPTTTGSGTPPPQPPPSGSFGSGGTAAPSRPSPSDAGERMPSNPRMEKNPSDGQPRRDNY